MQRDFLNLIVVSKVHGLNRCPIEAKVGPEEPRRLNPAQRLPNRRIARQSALPGLLLTGPGGCWLKPAVSRKTLLVAQRVFELAFPFRNVLIVPFAAYRLDLNTDVNQCCTDLR